MKIHTKLHNANNSEKHFEKSTDMMCIRLSLTTESFLNAFNRSCLVTFNTDSFNPRSLLEEIVTRSLDGGGGGFNHGNSSQINDVTGGRLIGFSNFQILFKFSLLYLRLMAKQHLTVEIHDIGRIHCEVASI